MQIESFRIRSYKAFSDSGVVIVAGGMNVIVGANNAGKTSIVEALSLGLPNTPHRSPTTVPLSEVSPEEWSSTTLEFSLTAGDVREILMEYSGLFMVPVVPAGARDPSNSLTSGLQNGLNVVVDVNTRGGTRCYLKDHDVKSWNAVNIFRYDRTKHAIVSTSGGASHYSEMLLSGISKRMYQFRAERLNVGICEVGDNPILASNAANLPETLHYLQTHNPSRFRRYCELVKSILPDVQGITTPLMSKMVRIDLWPIDTDSERADLAIPLSQSGTGVGQILAMLYVIVMASSSRVILIDEPQSFLHPGAVRRLVDVLQDYKQHQYIIATHSPALISAASPDNILLVQKRGFESCVTRVGKHDIQQMELVLSEVGARLSDVFGADAVLWVEGPTEEKCYSELFSLSKTGKPAGVEILGVINTGDFEGPQAEVVIQAYNKISRAGALLPPAIAFLFDLEERTQTDVDDLRRSSSGAVHFLDRRMFENYLLVPEAIAAVLSGLDTSGRRYETTTVADWIEDNLRSERYQPRRATAVITGSSEALVRVHAANLLKDLFRTLSDNTLEYRKTAHGLEIVRWLMKNQPEALAPLVSRLEHTLKASA